MRAWRTEKGRLKNNKQIQNIYIKTTYTRNNNLKTILPGSPISKRLGHLQGHARHLLSKLEPRNITSFYCKHLVIIKRAIVSSADIWTVHITKLGKVRNWRVCPGLDVWRCRGEDISTTDLVPWGRIFKGILSKGNPYSLQPDITASSSIWSSPASVLVSFK